MVLVGLRPEDAHFFCAPNATGKRSYPGRFWAIRPQDMSAERPAPHCQTADHKPVVHAQHMRCEGALFLLEDGSTRLQTDPQCLRSRLTAGMDISVRKAARGSFFLNVSTRRDIRVRRVD